MLEFPPGWWRNLGALRPRFNRIAATITEIWRYFLL